jgi:WD40 repeat protein
VASRKLIATLTDPGPASVYSVAFSPDGTMLAVGNNFAINSDSTGGNTYLWNVSSGKPVATLTDPGSDASVNSFAFSPDGTLLAAGDDDNSAYLWSLATRKRTATFTNPDGSHVQSVRFSPDGKILAVGATYGSTYLWNVP